MDDDDGEVIVKGLKRDLKGTEFAINDGDLFTITSKMILNLKSNSTRSKYYNEGKKSCV